MTLEELREALLRLPPAQLERLLRDVFGNPGTQAVARRVVADLVTHGVLAQDEGGQARLTLAPDAEVEEAAEAFIGQYRPALERLARL